MDLKYSVLAFSNLECPGEFKMFTILVGGVDDHRRAALHGN